MRGRSHIAGSWLPSPKPDLERQLDEVRAKISALEADRLNRKLTARLLVDGIGDNTAASSTGKASDGHG